jgi:GNAT superfamily N-acetyltransferase
MKVRQIPTEATYDLRGRVLRPSRPLADCQYPKDPEAVHFGVEDEAGCIVSLMTAHPDPYPLVERENPWRIRGMATEPALQGTGLGSRVLLALLEWGVGEGIPFFWCNAREKAIPFYERHGFTVESELFEIDGIGPHRVMKRELGGSADSVRPEGPR